jgi:hypothetical protein
MRTLRLAQDSEGRVALVLKKAVAGVSKEGVAPVLQQLIGDLGAFRECALTLHMDEAPKPRQDLNGGSEAYVPTEGCGCVGG